MYNYIKVDTYKEIKPYFLGFIFSVILTVLPFLLVIHKIFSSNINYIIILICAVSQIIIHFIFFLHLNISTIEGKWNLITLIFVTIIVFIIFFGSIWIMLNLNHHMPPYQI